MSADSEKLNTLALEAKTDEAKLEELIRQNTRFILNCAGKTSGRYITTSDDEWSVSLIAFHEAVRSYDRNKGDFAGFAALVIRRRLLDSRGKNLEYAVALSDSVPEEGEMSALESEVQRRVTEEAMQREQERTATRDEIEALGQILGTYGISFPELARHSPKARKTRTACAGVIRAMLSDEQLIRQLRKNGTLPGNQIRKKCNIPLYVLDKHRKYIIAAVEILHGDFPILAEYLHYVREGGEET